MNLLQEEGSYFIMKSCEKLIAPESDYFIYVPSLTARETFFYPLYTGHFFYEKGYSLHRDSYDSFLVLYIQKGQMSVTLSSETFSADAGTFLLLDCYNPHSYSALTDCEVYWCHFDGPLATKWFQLITSQSGNVITLTDIQPAFSRLLALYRCFAENMPPKEPLFSKYLTDILSSFLLYAPSAVRTPESGSSMEETIAYINEHFSEKLSVETLSSRAALSPYHFIRTFQKETGFTPHEYLLNIRINTAKYLLKNSSASVKYICFHTGFASESVFCSAFKKRTGMTPSEYRLS